MLHKKSSSSSHEVIYVSSEDEEEFVPDVSSDKYLPDLPKIEEQESFPVSSQVADSAGKYSKDL